MKQYIEMKQKHPDAVLLFRVGDFYETFSDDAVTASEILGITLTRRANGSASSVELAGFPHHALDTYLPKLVRAGKRVAICEQLEDPKLTKKLVKRGITELVTPGVNTNSNSLDAAETNYLAGIHVGKTTVGVAFLDVTTGEFCCASGNPRNVDKLISTLMPRELLRMRGTRDFCEKFLSYKGSIFELDDWVYTEDAARERLLKQFSTASLKGFGVDSMPEAVIAAGSLIHYLDITGHERMSHITSLRRIDEDAHVRLDRFTLRNLEVIDPMGPEGKSLFDVINKTRTPMGGRLLRKWLLFPELDIKEITRRQDATEYFFKSPEVRCAAADILHPIGDLGRLSGRLGSGKITPREMWQLAEAAEGAVRLKTILSESGSEVLAAIAENMPTLTGVARKIKTTITPPSPGGLKNDSVIADGIDADLDNLRDLRDHSRQALDSIKEREMEATGINSLKIGFNNVFGYYLEVRNTHKDKVPESWVRKQTLVSAERYITPELKEYEEKLLGASERIAEIEERLYNKLKTDLGPMQPDISANTDALARVDCLLSFADAAEQYGYVRPVVDDGTAFSITEGRHPVIERTLPLGETYVSNSVELDCDNHQILMLTGPNMSGKSALLRQTALIALMAQTGSFVPAQAARIGVVDKIFTRVGASDNISSGESTFMVEMNEAASILNNLSDRSLVLFDELGRGTSTYDGISIAWAIVEHIHNNPRVHPKTLFATHYHELNEMERSFDRVVNFNVSVKEIDGKVVFLRKLARGGSEHSFGIHVAKLAGMPSSIVARAGEVLRNLEETYRGGEDAKTAMVSSAASLEQSGNHGVQLSFFQLDDPVLSQIRDELLKVDINNLTPVAALNKLHDIRKILTGKEQ